jgi:hypothetical protein
MSATLRFWNSSTGGRSSFANGGTISMMDMVVGDQRGAAQAPVQRWIFIGQLGNKYEELFEPSRVIYHLSFISIRRGSYIYTIYLRYITHRLPTTDKDGMHGVQRRDDECVLHTTPVR